ncbi:putative DNA-binding protein [Oceanirhabdus sp. W0125-5]|uniref:putative DNA-binding protein n=1 Tax=Oceanirhabdus sp. W0125-5 TaxID=2999116 RepID=UPI0022F34443|nr:putative DNA-binding protein [Oceanirhabdus sp. W0125-5]WBW94807.1 putative DNA-binding protein [Oceanirhabdus sp. W0125-5]
MDKRFEISFLLDCYGALLTENQKNVMELYYNADLSLAEIAENTGKSRQAVHDLIKRSEKTLYDYESKLSYLNKRLSVDKLTAKVNDSIDDITSEDEINREKLLGCLNDVLKFLNEIY